MFAYCGNNPIIFVDSSGFKYYPYMVRLDEDGGGYPIHPYIADTPEEQTYGMINGQSNLPYSEAKIGLGSYGQSGCAYIAIYNAMQLTGHPKSLSSITHDVFWDHGTVCFGAGGVGPWSIESYIRTQKMEYTSSYSLSGITDGISEGSVIIFTVWNNATNIFDGWHAMTALYTNGKYLVFNQYNNSKTYRTYSSLGDAFSKGAWIHGIRIN